MQNTLECTGNYIQAQKRLKPQTKKQKLLVTIIISVVSIAVYLTDKGQHIMLYKINKNVYIRTSKIITIVIILYSSHTHMHTQCNKE